MKDTNYGSLWMLVLVLFSFSSMTCSSNTSSNNTSQNCEGCLDTKGNCKDGDSNNYCGIGGVECEKCSTGYQCSSETYQCESITTTTTCNATTCFDGCCGQDGQCKKINNGMTNQACGYGTPGAACIDCTQNNMICSTTTGQCEQQQSQCSCENKCANEDNGCGMACPSNTCKGCCYNGTCIVDGLTNAQACGKNGGNCLTCDSGIPCTNGICSTTCIPDCAGKCNGADNGCQTGTCQICDKGCCNTQTSTCETADNDSACGSTGNCINCLAYSPAKKCSQKVCVDPGILDSTYQVKVINNNKDAITIQFATDLDLNSGSYNSFTANPGESVSPIYKTTAGQRTLSYAYIDPSTVRGMCENHPGFTHYSSLTGTVLSGKNSVYIITLPADATYKLSIANTTGSNVYVYIHSWLDAPDQYYCSFSSRNGYKGTLTGPTVAISQAFTVKWTIGGQTYTKSTTQQTPAANSQTLWEMTIP